jgi:hypothetical protein
MLKKHFWTLFMLTSTCDLCYGSYYLHLDVHALKLIIVFRRPQIDFMGRVWLQDNKTEPKMSALTAAAFYREKKQYYTRQRLIHITALFHWCGWKSAVMILLRRCLECLKNYFHLWGLQKSLVAAPLVIFSVAPLVKTIFLDSPVTAQ